MWRKLGGRIVTGVLALVILARIIQWGAKYTSLDHAILQGYWDIAVAIITILGLTAVGAVIREFEGMSGER